VPPETWHPGVAELIAENVIIGDCRQEAILKQAGITACRAVLIVTSDESINIETAIAARRLNASACLVIRSARTKLNQLLQSQLGNLIALEPTEITANAFAIAALGKGTLGLFNIKNYWFRTAEQIVQPKDSRFENLPIYRLHKQTYRLISFSSHQEAADQSSPIPAKQLFYQWSPDAQVHTGEQIIFLELIDPQISFEVEQPISSSTLSFHRLQSFLKTLFKSGLKIDRQQFARWLNQDSTRKLTTVGSITAVLLWLLGAVTLRFNIPKMTWQKAFSSSVILLLGGYGDVFGGLEPEQIPAWVQVVCFAITIVSLLFILGVLGILAENVLSSRLEMFRRQLPVPQRDHTLVVGLGRVGRQIIALLHRLNLPVVGLTEHLENANFNTPVPILSGTISYNLGKANIDNARSVITTTDDQILNLEIALTAREIARATNRQINVVVRTYEQQFSDNLIGLLPDMKAMCVDALAAEAFTGAAFGENMLGLFTMHGHTILIVEYQIAQDDQLMGKNLAQVAYGFNVVPVFYERYSPLLAGEQTQFILPQDDLVLHQGDRLVVLAAIDGLHRIERGEITPPSLWTLEAEQPLNPHFLLELSNELIKIAGCDLQIARQFIQNLPGSLVLPLYDSQAYRLKQELGRSLPLKIRRIKKDE
jgi:Trk K+ transport system NAD-binding subunit